MAESEKVDAKALEESLKEAEKENLKKMDDDEKTSKEGGKRYAGGPIPRGSKK